MPLRTRHSAKLRWRSCTKLVCMQEGSRVAIALVERYTFLFSTFASAEEHKKSEFGMSVAFPRSTSVKYADNGSFCPGYALSGIAEYLPSSFSHAAACCVACASTPTGPESSAAYRPAWSSAYLIAAIPLVPEEKHPRLQVPLHTAVRASTNSTARSLAAAISGMSSGGLALCSDSYVLISARYSLSRSIRSAIVFLE